MSVQIQLRRGTEEEHKTFTGVVGEVTVVTTDNSLRVHNGEKAGGYETATQRWVYKTNGFSELNDGVWASGQIFTAYNQYMIYDGEAYSPMPSTKLPYTVGAVPDLKFVYKVQLNSIQGLSGLNAIYQKTFLNLSELQLSLIDEIGAYVRVKNSNGVEHVRVVSNTDDGSGLLLSSGKYANLVVVEPNTIYASQLGWGSNSTQTKSINSLASKLTNEGITNIVLDTGNIKFEGTLDFIYGAVTFSGSGELEIDNKDNMLQRIKAARTEDKKYHGSYNIGAILNQAIKTATFVKREIRVVLFGDSISVGNDYDSGSIKEGFVNTVGVDNEDRHDCLAAQIYTELLASLPKGTRIKFYSRSIGGLGYGNIDQPWDSLNGLFEGREQATAGKTWRDCVLDLNPDLVIHSMGMNESATSYIDGLNNKWVNYLSTKQKLNTFDQAILTTPNPNFNTAQQFGNFTDYGLNASKFYVSTMQRYAARRYNYSLIDVAFNSYLKRYGFDPRSCTFRTDASALTFKDGSTTKVIGVGSGISNTECTPNYYPIYHSTTFTMTPPVTSDTSGFDFKFVAGSVILQFTAGQINLFTGIYNQSIGVVVITKNLILPAKVSSSFTVTVTPSGVFVYHGNKLLMANVDAVYNATLPIFFENPASSQDVVVNSGRIRGAQFARYSADMASNGEMYGELQYTSNKFGGGINHPSTVGLVEVYLPPVREFLTDMTRASTVVSSVIGGTAGNQTVFIGRIAAIDYSRVTIKEYGSGLDISIQVRVIGGVVSYNVQKNSDTGSLVTYIDSSDLSVFLVNVASSLLQFEYTGEWLSKAPFSMGINETPRGTALSTVA